MTAQIIDGKAIAADLRARVAACVARMEEKPGLTVVLVGDDPASAIYVASKHRETLAAGMRSATVRLPADTSEGEVVSAVRALSADPSVDGILVQLPLPPHIDAVKVLAAIDPAKDVDGLTEWSAGRLALGRPGLRSCTPSGVIILAKSVHASLAGAHVLVIGRSILVGRPVSLLFLGEDCTVTMAHSRSKDLKALCLQADILVPAVGRPEMVRGDWVKAGATVLDVGINRLSAPEKGEGKTRVVGDVAFAEARERAAFITPVPGGVGPMTVACLLRNTVLAAAARRGLSTPDI